MAEQIKMTVTIPTDQKTLYDAWLDSEKHSEFSSANVKIEKQVGSTFFAMGGIVEGKILGMIRNREISLTWNSAEFPEGTGDTKVTITFEPNKDQTKMIVVHENLPDGMGKEIRKIWKDKYFNPMKKYFAK